MAFSVEPADGQQSVTPLLHPFFAARLSGVTAQEKLVLSDFLKPAGEWRPGSTLRITQELVPVAGGAITVRIYRCEAESPRPAVLWMHGGGWVDGALDWGEAHGLGAELAERTKAVVVSVGYRLAADGFRYPVPLDDVEAAWDWLGDHSLQLGVGGPRFIGGASAGANLAAAAAMRLRDEGKTAPDAMLLAYGLFHRPLPRLSCEQEQLMSDLPDAVRIRDREGQGVFDPYDSTPVPGHYTAPGNRDLAGMPATAILACEFDDLRASSELFARQLQSAGVPVRTHLAHGMLHGHLNWFPADALAEVDSSIEFFAEAVRTLTPQGWADAT